MHNVNESGRSMMEMLGVLGIMGVMMYGAVAGINFGLDIYRVNATYNEVEELSKGLMNMSWFVDDLSFISRRTLCQQDLVPCDGRQNMKNQWEGDITVTSVASGIAGQKPYFVIVYSGIPRVACRRLRDDVYFSHVCLRNNPCDSASNTMEFVSREHGCDD